MIFYWLDGQRCLYPFTSTLPLTLASVLSQAAAGMKMIHGFCWISEPSSPIEQLKP